MSVRACVCECVCVCARARVRARIASHILKKPLLDVFNTYMSSHSTGAGGCSSVGKSSDRHAAEAGSIPRYGKGFFS